MISQGFLVVQREVLLPQVIMHSRGWDQSAAYELLVPSLSFVRSYVCFSCIILLSIGERKRYPGNVVRVRLRGLLAFSKTGNSYWIVLRLCGEAPLVQQVLIFLPIDTILSRCCCRKKLDRNLRKGNEWSSCINSI